MDQKDGAGAPAKCQGPSVDHRHITGVIAWHAADFRPGGLARDQRLIRLLTSGAADRLLGRRGAGCQGCAEQKERDATHIDLLVTLFRKNALWFMNGSCLSPPSD